MDTVTDLTRTADEPRVPGEFPGDPISRLIAGLPARFDGEPVVAEEVSVAPAVAPTHPHSEVVLYPGLLGDYTGETTGYWCEG